MLKTHILVYVAVLFVAFAVGLVGTLAATRYVTAVASDDAPSLERPAVAPYLAPGYTPTVEC